MKRTIPLDISALLLILVANAVFLNFNAFRVFNTFDMGGALDVGWRIYTGQRPYLDFIYHGGILFPNVNAFFFHLFGFGKTAVLANLLTVHSLVIALVFFMLRHRVPAGINILTALLVTPSFYWSISHPWHDQLAHLWGIIAITVFVKRRACGKTDRGWDIGLTLGLMTMLSLLSKSNIGAGYAVLFFSLCLVSSRRCKTLFGYGAGILGGVTLAAFLISSPQEFFQQTLTHSQAVHTRLANVRIWQNWFSSFYWLPFGIVLISALPYYQSCGALLLLFTGITVIGIYSVLTGGMLPSANNFLWGIQAALGFLLLYSLKPSLSPDAARSRFRISLNLLVLTTTALIGVSIKNGLELKTWRYIPGNPLGNTTLKTGPLRGWKIDEKKGQAIDALTTFIQTNVPRRESLLNLTDLYVIYAVTGRDSFRGIPVIFWREEIPAKGRQAEQVSRTILTHPPEWIIVDAMSYQQEIPYLNLTGFIADSYVPAFQTGNYQFLQKIKK